ncbi:type III-B CRISPR module RAMP protein Cmr4 [Phocaeicola barnesiae]|uniref:type III-B CRISPR module RAMP protein Cmr4 n=1 Tax=Phocaeicola barnesiae TaxID=376804 RepID=UPI00243039F6|nr:type III-B CRISPR module RAMP protein Cmr4 [Phocaeicola barnesiae]
MKTEFYVLTTMSNMHVGSGEYNVGVIDNLVQRDVINKFPNINSSSLKGAFREFFKSEKNDDFIKRVFGSAPKAQDDKASGSFRFFEANILSYPVRSNVVAYLRAVSIDVLKEFLLKIKMFQKQNDYKELVNVLNFLTGIDVKEKKPIVFNTKLDKAIVEDFELKAEIYSKDLDNTMRTALYKYFGKRVVLLHNNDFQRLCGENMLPVISRNYLESGESKNLWYEEVVPRLTQFYFPVMEEDRDADDFESKLSNSLIQFGGNASIGYGYSKIEPILSLNLEPYEN